MQQAEKTGIRFHFRSALTKMIGEQSRLTHVHIAALTESDPPSGHPAADARGVTPLRVDTLLVGAGRFPELIYVARQPASGQGSEQPQDDRQNPTAWETVTPYPGPQAEPEFGIFRPGEATTDYKAVVDAIGSGRRAAISIHQFLMGDTFGPPERMIRKTTEVLSVDEIEAIPNANRRPMPQLSRAQQLADPSSEIELGYDEMDAAREAERCLRCGLICYRRSEGKDAVDERENS